MSDIDNVELSYQYTINKLENEMAELRKDKERLDWILSGAGGFWLSTREDIDKEKSL